MHPAAARAASGQAAAAPSDEINSRRLMCFSPYKDSVPFVSFRRGREVLIAEIRLRRPSDNDEAAICRLMARIARCGQAIEGCRELGEIAGCDRAFELGNSASDDCIDHVAHWDIVIARNQ